MHACWPAYPSLAEIAEPPAQKHSIPDRCAGLHPRVKAAGRDATLAGRTWVLITESPDGGWGINGHASTGADIAEAARSELASKPKEPLS